MSHPEVADREQRVIKFRAWAKSTVDNRWKYAWSKSNDAELEPNRNTQEWSDWYDRRENLLHRYLEEWDTSHDETERYTVSHEMLTKFYINSDMTVINPAGYEIEHLMQYTGLKDKNGKDVYEGDIVTEEGGHFIGEVQLTEYTSFGIDAKDQEHIGWIALRKVDSRKQPLPELYKIEVIGNRFEHPELLQRKSE